MTSFYSEAIGTLKTSGTVSPSSKFLIRDILKSISFNEVTNIVEFGAGDGCITREIGKRMNPKSQLYSFEINEHFYKLCSDEFNALANVQIIQESALNFNSILAQENIHQVDVIISSLPISLFSDKDLDELLSKAKQYLKPEGLFIQYQYSLFRFRKVKQFFQKVNLDFTVRNLPPAAIYTCSNP